MKILFLQYWYDFYGGIETVNDSLATQFSKDGYDVTILCLWECKKNEKVISKNYQKQRINIEPKRPSYKKMIQNLIRCNFSMVVSDIKKLIKVSKQKKMDIEAYINKINELNPDFIIVSNHELIKLVPSKHLSRTILHMHSNVEQYIQSKKELKLLLKYQKKINSIVWLTSNFSEVAKQHGIYNSSFINNPVRIKCDKINCLEKKNIVFIGRLAKVKRVDMLTQIFYESKLFDKGWNLNIYGTGEIDDIKVHSGINLKGGTNNIKEVLFNSSLLALTSYSEGFPMVILEAYECGIPVIIYDYGVSSKEIVLNNKTGIIVPMSDKKFLRRKVMLFV